MVAECLGFRGWFGQSGESGVAPSELPPIPAPVRRKSASGLSAMLKLLESRLKLKFHLETKELPVYSLKVTKPGKLIQAEGECGSLPEGSARERWAGHQ